MAKDLLVGLADTVETREAVYRFRLERGVRSRDTLLPDAQILRGGLRDDLDPLAALVIAKDLRSGALVGTVRTNFVHEGAIPLFTQLYGLFDRSPGDLFRTTITSGWTTTGEVRGDHVPLALAQGVAEVVVRERVGFDFLDCLDAERPFFERIGYRRLRTIPHPAKGETHLMMLDVRDCTLLQALEETG